MAEGMAADTSHSLSAQAHRGKGGGVCLKAGYPLSEEQIAAIRSVTSSGGRVAIIEGAAGSGKTTTLRPIADLYREHGSRASSPRPWPGARRWRLATMSMRDRSASTSCCALPRGAGSRLTMETPPLSSMKRGCCRPVRRIIFSSSPERHGAKIVFAGDTQQQQPVEAGPGLRLVRDAVGSVRVDRIRRQIGGPGGCPDPYPGGDILRGCTAPHGEFDGRGAGTHPHS